MSEDSDGNVTSPIQQNISAPIFAPDLVNKNSSSGKNSSIGGDENTDQGGVFILYFFFPWLEQLVEKAASKITMSFPPAPPQLIPYRDYVETYFEVKKKGSSLQVEILGGVINFFASMYVLAVIPNQMVLAGYNEHVSVSIVGLIIGIATIASGMISNTPLVIAPPTSIAIFFVVVRAFVLCILNLPLHCF